MPPRLVDIVSEGDLLHRVETGTERLPGRPRSWWLDTIASGQELARDYVSLTSHRKRCHAERGYLGHRDD